jgi:hypothetical protein
MDVIIGRALGGNLPAFFKASYWEAGNSTCACKVTGVSANAKSTRVMSVFMDWVFRGTGKGPNSKGLAKVVEVVKCIALPWAKGGNFAGAGGHVDGCCHVPVDYFSKVMVPNWSVLSAV